MSIYTRYCYEAGACEILEVIYLCSTFNTEHPKFQNNNNTMDTNVIKLHTYLLTFPVQLINGLISNTINCVNC